jgi:periplasmic divalent cation tolerance protein
MYSVVLTTTPSREVAMELARGLVEGRSAACVNVLPVTSVYRWKGEVQEYEEHLLVIKTRRTLVDDIMDRLRESHPYEVPELIALEVLDGSPDYLRWIRDETERSKEGP